MCGKPFCSCCPRAYLEGLGDGFELGFKRGHNVGYVTGYVDGVLELAPPPAYRREIKSTLDKLLTPRPDPAITAILGMRPTCRCLGTCVCGWG
jgi:hypothetical protein